MTHAVTAMPKYKSYKDSGIEKIGVIPSHWGTRKVKFCTDINSESLPENTTGNYKFTYVDIGGVSLEKGIETTESYVFKEAPSRARRIAQSGDIIVSTVRTYLKAIAAVTEDTKDYIYSTGFAVVSSRKGWSSKFLANFIKSNAFTDQVDLVAKGMSYPAINSTELSNLYLLSIPQTEQEAIAKFLDEKTAQIDEAIGIKEQQIALLKERKQIIIQNAVTKGLNPKAAMKDSGFEWLGSIPEHWEVEKGKWLFKKGNRPVQQDDDIITCFRDGEVTLRKNRRTDGFTNALQEIGYQRICVGDLVIHAMDAFAGAIGVSDSNGKSSPVYSACTPLKENTVDPYYYAYFLRNLALSGVILSLAKGIRERSTDFRFNDFGALQLSVPPIQEQKEIVKYIDTECQKIETGISAQIEQIEKFKEYKSSLINSAVTGKIKVI